MRKQIQSVAVSRCVGFTVVSGFNLRAMDGGINENP